MNGLKYSFILLLFSILAISCNKDEIEVSSDKNEFHQEDRLLNRDTWNDNEQHFFSLEERESLVSSTRNKSSNGKIQNSYYHPLVVESYNFLVQQNDIDHFVNDITKKVGYPMWSKSRVFYDSQEGVEFISLPFAFAQQNKVTALFLITKDESGSFVIDGVAREEIIENLESCTNYNLAKELIIADKWAFDYIDSNLLSDYTDCSGNVNASPPTPPPACIWITVEICSDESTQTTFVAGSQTILPPHLDHDNDGVPNDLDQDWVEWSARYNITQAELEAWWIDYWASNYEQDNDNYEDFFDQIDQYIDDYNDLIFDGWFDFDDQWDDSPDDQGDQDDQNNWDIFAGGGPWDCPWCFTNNKNNISTRNIRCEWYVIKDCSDAINGDLEGSLNDIFDEVIPCPDCNNNQYNGEEERFREYYTEKYIAKYNITDQSIIDQLDQYSLTLLGVVDVEIFEMLMEEKHQELWFAEYPSLLNQRDAFLNNHPNDEYAEDLANEHWRQMVLDSEYREFVESSLAFGGVMWSIAAELIGDKVVDIIIGLVPGFGQADEIRDAIKAAKNGDVLEFLYEAAKVVGKNTPLGKFLKGAEAFSTLSSLFKKIEKISDKIDSFADDVLEQMWSIVSKYDKSILTNSELYLGIAKTINRGLKSIDDMVTHASVPYMDINTVKHILRGEGFNSGRHHISAVVSDPIYTNNSYY